MKLIVGLGNPGEKYQGTRHNVGFKIVDSFRFKIESPEKIDKPYVMGSMKWKEKDSAEYWKGSFNGEQFVVIKPQKFMNVSGEVVARFANLLKIDTHEDLWVVHDELDLPIGTFKIQKNVSAAGHNGVKSIIENIGHQDFVRFRFGIGRPADQTPIDDYVLQDFRTPEEQHAAKMRIKCAEAIVYALENGLTAAMNEYNQ